MYQKHDREDNYRAGSKSAYHSSSPSDPKSALGNYTTASEQQKEKQKKEEWAQDERAKELYKKSDDEKKSREHKKPDDDHKAEREARRDVVHFREFSSIEEAITQAIEQEKKTVVIHQR